MRPNHLLKSDKIQRSEPRTRRESKVAVRISTVLWAEVEIRHEDLSDVPGTDKCPSAGVLLQSPFRSSPLTSYGRDRQLSEVTSLSLYSSRQKYLGF